MIEGIMLFALGALVAGLLSAAILPAFWRRAERLVRRELERQLPLSPREIAAERDQLRATFAVSQRKLEQRVEAVEAARLDDRRQLGGTLVALDAAHGTIAVRDEAIADLESTVAARDAAIAALEASLAGETSAHGETAASLRALNDAHATLNAEYAAMTALAETRAAEIGALMGRLAEEAQKLTREQAGHADTRQSLADQMRLHKDLQTAFVTLREQAEDRRRTISDHLQEIARLKEQMTEQAGVMQTLRQTIQSKTGEINALQRDLADARNKTAMAGSRADAADALAARRQQAIEAKNDTLQAKGSQINALGQQLGALRVDLSTEAEARRVAERSLDAAQRRIATLEATVQQLKLQSQETARDLSRTIEALRSEAGRNGRQPPDSPRTARPASRNKPLEFAATGIPESDIVGLPPRK